MWTQTNSTSGCSFTIEPSACASAKALTGEAMRETGTKTLIFDSESRSVDSSMYRAIVSLREDSCELALERLGGVLDVPPGDRVEDVERTSFHDLLQASMPSIRSLPMTSTHVNIDRVKTIATLGLPAAARRPARARGGRPLAAALRVLAEPARLRLLSLIQAQPGREACVCHLTEPLGLSQPTVSHHLKVLLQAGLVEREQRGSWAFFRVRPEPLAALRAILT